MCPQTQLTTVLPKDRIFACIVQFKQTHDGLSPSVFQIAQACHFSAQAVQAALTELEREKHIQVLPEGIAITGASWSPPTAPPRPVEDLSPVAKAIAKVDPCLIGKQPKSMRYWGDLTGYTHSHILNGFRELAEKGLAQAVPFGANGRKRYVANLTSFRAVA